MVHCDKEKPWSVNAIISIVLGKNQKTFHVKALECQSKQRKHDIHFFYGLNKQTRDNVYF